MAVGEAFLSAFLQVLFDRLASREFVEFFRGRKYDDLLEKLKITLLSVTALLNDAEGKQFYYPAVRKWLHMAKGVLYDAEDILDKLATEALTTKLESESKTEANQVANWRLISSPLSPFSRGVDSELNKIIEKLELVAKYKDVLGLNDVKGRLSESKQRLPTTSMVDDSCVYGRDKDKNMIIESLLTDDLGSRKVCVVPVVGMGGIGKTTLAQLVYNDSRVEKHFALRIWVCVSDRFDVRRVIKTILSSVTSKSVDFDDLNLLQVSLRKKLAGKRFLLVLDDVWSRRNNDWDLIWNPLKTGATGSKIIVTTRDSNIAASMGTVPAHQLEFLSFEDCLSVFLNHAIENPNFYSTPDMLAVATEIVKKCEGLPLVAKRLGILLRSRQKGEWYDASNRKIWDLPDDGDDIFQTIGLSYHHLPPHLKQCFAYCSIFPSDYEFDKESLILLWMAEGFLQQPTGNKKLEEVGVEYFDELVSRSFFQQSVHNSSLYVMHGLMKDLAQFVSGDYCFRLEDKVMNGCQKRIFDKARHSSYNRSRREMLRKFDAFYGVECLRTFLPLDPTGEIGASFLANKVPSVLLPKLKYLRVLSFNACRITELPNSIGELKHLHYINLSRSAVKTLPGSIGSLYNLQTLILVECYSLSKLPTEIGNLTNLRHLRISGSRLVEMPLQICRLTNLQTLSHFVVGKDSGSGIGDLKDIHQLQGALLISGLQNVVSFIDAIEANLKDKNDLTQLTLQWSNDFDGSMRDRDEEEVFKTRQHRRNRKDLAISSYKIPRFPSFRETLEAYRRESVKLQLERSRSLDDSRNERIEKDVLEMLQPHKNIEKLMIKDYGGTRFPSWIGSPLFSNLAFLQLSNCSKCQFLPPVGQLPSLKDLTIEGMRGIKMVGTEFYGDGCSFVVPFPSLETLKFENLSAWEEWSSSGLEGMDDFPQLQSIEIRNCRKLRKFQQHFPTLKKMTISGCENLEALPRLQALDSSKQGRDFSCLLELYIWACPNLMELPTCFPSLIILQIDGCQKLRILPKLPSISELELTNCDGKVLQSVVGQSSLTYIRIHQILNLGFLVEDFFQDLTALEELQISQLGQLTTLSNNIGLQSLLSLQLLEISGCPCLKELPDNLYKLTSLKVLRISNCPSLVSLMGLPSTLLGLEIKTCEALQSLSERMIHESCRSKNPLSLEYLFIEGCTSLISLPRDELSGSLKELEIQNCWNLESLPEEIICNSSLLEILKISGCHSVKSFPKATFQLPKTSSNGVMKLRELIISNCKNLESLPEGLHNLILLDHLEISDCPLLQSFPKPGLSTSMVRSIRISNCQNLRFLPNRMYRLTSLEELSINRCSSLESFPEGGLPANLISLSIMDCKNLKPSSQWGLHKLNCLTEFSFGGCQELVSFPDSWLLPTNLSSLHLEHLPNLKSLPKGLKNLKNLETLETWNCDSLRTVPEEEPTTVLPSLWNAF